MSAAAPKKKAAAKKPAAKRAAGKKKDPNAPKRALSAYMFFAQAERPNIIKANPDATFGEVGKLIGAAWREADDDTKKKYEAKSAADKKRYEKEMAAYAK